MTVTPIRRCVGWGRLAPQAELRRFVARGNELALASQPTAGRGAYTCDRLSCFERAFAHNGFSRALRTRVRIDPALIRIYTDERHG
jgi:predicted RNA-binding protein YlxR (DUF448 family)